MIIIIEHWNKSKQFSTSTKVVHSIQQKDQQIKQTRRVPRSSTSSGRRPLERRSLTRRVLRLRRVCGSAILDTNVLRLRRVCGTAFLNTSVLRLRRVGGTAFLDTSVLRLTTGIQRKHYVQQQLPMPSFIIKRGECCSSHTKNPCDTYRPVIIKTLVSTKSFHVTLHVSLRTPAAKCHLHLPYINTENNQPYKWQPALGHRMTYTSHTKPQALFGIKCPHTIESVREMTRPYSNRPHANGNDAHKKKLHSSMCQRSSAAITICSIWHHQFTLFWTDRSIRQRPKTCHQNIWHIGGLGGHIQSHVYRQQINRPAPMTIYTLQGAVRVESDPYPFQRCNTARTQEEVGTARYYWIWASDCHRSKPSAFPAWNHHSGAKG